MNLTEHIQELISELENCLTNDVYDRLLEVVEILREAKKTGKTVYTFGNGGSHSTASHFACDLLKACGIKAICIGDMIPGAYAYMNDEGRVTMFNEIARTLYFPMDIAVAFSCSGNSINVVNALANFPGKTILFTGETGGDAQHFSKLVIRVYNPNIRIQESAHSAYCHAIVEELLDGEV